MSDRGLVMLIGGRDVVRVVKAPLAAGHWRALARICTTYPADDVIENTKRYLAGGGAYPYRCRVRTPTGVLAFDLDARDDLFTVNEIFCRLDYAAELDLKVAVDIGANIGIASSYFLSRNTTSRIYAMEPDPKNIERYRKTTSRFGDRVELTAEAAGIADGEAVFYLEDTGRYGGFDQYYDGGLKTESRVVPVRSFTSFVDGVLDREGRIDVLKVDTEGSEVELVGSLRPEQLDRIDRVYYETDTATPLHRDRFDHRFSTQTNSLVRHGSRRR
jgi:FkbM family methyltransferase